jgi:hypothetical protein
MISIAHHCNKDLYKHFRNTATKLVKCDQIQNVLNRLGNNPGQKKAWQEAKVYLGKGSGSSLPECTSNTDPKLTADHQNEFFINKIEQLVTTMSSKYTATPPVSSNTSKSAANLSSVRECKLSPWLSPSQDKQSF